MSVSSRVRMSGPMIEYRAGFAAELVSLGYTDLSTAQQLRLMACLSDWLVDRGLEPTEFDDVAIEEFLEARRRAGHVEWRTRVGLAPMLGFLRGMGVVPTPAPAIDMSPAGQLIAAYRRYLTDERGMGWSARDFYVRVARRFLDHHAPAAGLGLGEVTAADVATFVLAECARRSVRSGVLSATRCLLRYLFVEGLVATELAWAVPSAAGRHGASLPKDLLPVQVKALLASCDRRRAIGRRDFAIITVLSRLGLRAGEAAVLSLDDIDWHSGDLVIRGKGRRDEVLPLPDDVGEAIVAYLRRGRPHCESRQVFIRVRAPWRGLSQPAVTEIVYRACARAGLPEVGAHRLRHTAATQMLRRGGTLAEVAQVLRHHDPLTTSTYAKVDRVALASLAGPWPVVTR